MAQKPSKTGTAYDATPAQHYELPTGPEVNFTYVQQVGNQPIIGGDRLASALSPFTLRVLPPLLYLQNPQLLSGMERGTRDNPIKLGYTTNAAIGNMANFKGTAESVGITKNAAFSGLGNSKPHDQPVSYVKGRNQARSGGSANRQSIGRDSQSESAITDMQTALDIATQLRRILNVPPLTLYINPTQMTTNYTKIQEYSQRSRSQIIFQTWGEEQPKLSITGKIGAFIAGATVSSGSQQRTTAPTGMQFASKRDSAAFQQLMSLMTFYRNNGYIYDTIGKSNAHHMVGVVEISYDHFTYIGNFQSFNWRYDEQHQNGGMEFDFEFTVVQMYDNHESTGPVRFLKSPTPNPNSYRADNQLGSPMQNNARNLSVYQFASPSVGGSTPTSGSAQTSPNLPGKAFQGTPATQIVPSNTVPMQAFFDPRKV